MRSVALFLALTAWSSAARSAGSFVPDLGAVALGRAGAVFARPGDVLALYFNPAGLMDLPGLRVQLDARLINQDVTFQRLAADGSNPERFVPVSNASGPQLGPMGAVTYRLVREGWPALAVGAGVFPLPGFRGFSYPDPAKLRADGEEDPEEIARLAPQRYTLIRSDSPVVYPVVGAAVRPLPWLALGGAVQMPVGSVASRLAVYAGPFAGESPDFDAIVDLRVAVQPTFSSVWGAQVTALDAKLALGVALQLPLAIHAEGTLDVELPPLADALGASVSGNRASLRLLFPWIARAGARWTEPAFDLEAALTVEGWSLYKDVRILPRDVVITQGGQSAPLPDLIIEKDMQDAVSARLGGELRPGAWAAWLEPLRVRAGALYETASIPLERQGIDFPQWDRLSLNAGLGFVYGPVDASVGYAHFFQPERQVEASALRQTVTSKDVERAVVGNGVYRSQVDILSVSLGASFDL